MITDIKDVMDINNANHVKKDISKGLLPVVWNPTR